MTALLATVCALLGLCVGSFLNVVVHRVPRKQSVVRPRSACPSCGTQLAERDNIPVVSWLLLRGRCLTCQAPIAWRYPALELACGALWAATAVRFGADWALPAFLVLAASLLALSAIDLEHRLLPNKVLYPTGYLLAPLLVVAALARHEPHRLVWAAIAAAASFAGFFALNFLYPRGMAFGDVRLSFVLGLAVGWLGLGLVLVSLFAAFLSASIVGVAWGLITRRGLKAAIPFGPFLAFGAEVAIFAGRPILDAYLGR